MGAIKVSYVERERQGFSLPPSTQEAGQDFVGSLGCQIRPECTTELRSNLGIGGSGIHSTPKLMNLDLAIPS